MEKSQPTIEQKQRSEKKYTHFTIPFKNAWCKWNGLTKWVVLFRNSHLNVCVCKLWARTEAHSHTNCCKWTFFLWAAIFFLSLSLFLAFVLLLSSWSDKIEWKRIYIILINKNSNISSWTSNLFFSLSLSFLFEFIDACVWKEWRHINEKERLATRVKEWIGVFQLQ